MQKEFSEYFFKVGSITRSAEFSSLLLESIESNAQKEQKSHE